MEDLIKTDMGLISRENANWLFSSRILNRKGNILNNYTVGISSKKVLNFSYLLWTIEGIKDICPTTPNGVSLNMNDYLTVARSGELVKPYKYEGQEFSYVVKNTPIENVERFGKEVFVRHQPETKNKKWDDSVFDDFKD